MDVRPTGNITLVMLVFLRKALSPILTTDFPAILPGIVIAPPMPVYPTIVIDGPFSVYVKSPNIPNILNP
jgi:hypothetical protein